MRARVIFAAVILLLGLPAFSSDLDTAAVSMRFSSAQPEDLVIANRNIITLRAEVFGNPPAVRVANIHKRIEQELLQPGELVFSDSSLFGGRGILINDHPILFIAAEDLDPSMGERMDEVYARTRERLILAIQEYREMHDARAMARNITWVIGYTILLGLVLYALLRVRRYIHRRAGSFIARSMARSGITGGLTRSHTLYVIAQRLAMLLVGILMLVVLYFWLTAVLGHIPYTRAWSDGMVQVLAKAGLWIFNGALEALPGLAMVAIIFFLTRAIVRVITAMFDRIARGEIEVTWLDAAIAMPTRRIIVLVIWVFALVIAYPFIPGSSSKAFQGISVLVGVMFSLGSSGVISQLISGLAMMFNRIIRVGEVVQVGDVVTGAVQRIGYFNSVITTSYGEEVTIPNAMVLSNKVTNLSRHGGNKGILFSTGVTIGYDAPWRQVHAMLLEAARTTPDIATDPAPVVNQHALNDFYVDYRLTLVLTGPFRQTLTALHASIQDIFNANGVQIMSPHYERDPVEAKVVPPEKRDPGIQRS